MRKNLIFLFLTIAIQGLAQDYPISQINISMASNPDANTSNWGSPTSMFTVTATAKSIGGRVGPNVIESRLLMTIKKGGTKICGDYTDKSAPSSNFSTMTKVWVGSNAVSYLGKGCVLVAGDYEICIQFFGEGPVGLVAISEEKCKTFTIKGIDLQAYQPPQCLAPVDGSLMNEADIKKPVAFRWTPLIPGIQVAVTYRLSVWQLMQGQNGSQAIKSNQPIFTKDIDNMTQALVSNLLSGSCKAPYLCSFVWTVQALNREGKPIGENNGTSKPSQFTVNSCDVNLELKLKSIECLAPLHGNNNYKICLSATYQSNTYNLTFSDPNSGFKAYAPSYTPAFSITLITPALQVQNSGLATTINYCFNVTVPIGQSAIKVGLQGDDKDPGPIVCQPGAEVQIDLPVCTSDCGCGSWGQLDINKVRCDCGGKMEWKCNQAINFSEIYHCNPSNESCQPKTNWQITNNGTEISSGQGSTGTYTPTSNGTYILTLSTMCNGKDCPPCTYTFIINNCNTGVCDFCKDNLGVSVINDDLTLSDNNINQATLSGSFTGLDPNRIKKIESELIYFSFGETSDSECERCTENQSWGNFMAPASSGFNGYLPPVLTGQTFGRLWTWTSKIDKACDEVTGGGTNQNSTVISEKSLTPTNSPVVRRKNFFLPILLPPCSDRIKICVRFTFYDFCCHACQVIKCYEIKRKEAKQIQKN